MTMKDRFVIMWFVSLAATSGSLYLSEAMGFIPCTLCWYQRILMYPLFILLTMALIRQEWVLVPYIRVVSIFGASIALYQYLQQRIPAFADLVDTCKIGIPCRNDYLNWLNGWVTIPFLSLIAFLMIVMLCFTWSKEAN
jgi:disulfide bond formation protein DsbB